jgi:hypothetical protein
MSAASETYRKKAAHDIADEIKTLACRIGLLLDALEQSNPSLAEATRREMLECANLHRDDYSNSVFSQQNRPRSRSFQSDAEMRERVPEIESEIMNIIAAEGGDVSLSLLHERLQEIGPEISKGTLSVRLHRMVTSGRLVSPSRAHYALSSSEQARHSEKGALYPR